MQLNCCCFNFYQLLESKSFLCPWIHFLSDRNDFKDKQNVVHRAPLSHKINFQLVHRPFFSAANLPLFPLRVWRCCMCADLLCRYFCPEFLHSMALGYGEYQVH